ncbi:DciA family protein [Lysobacter humi (ex Lee et al. 2017)]
MSDSKSSRSRKASGPIRDALDALLAEPAGDPVRRALWLDGLDRRLRPCLPAEIAAHVRLANFDRGRLVFVVDAPAWRARVRLATPELLHAARSIGLAANDVVIRTSPGTPADRPVKAPRPMSAASQQALQAALASLRDIE